MSAPARRVFLFHNMVAPYRHSLFIEMAARCQLQVGYAIERSRDRNWSTRIPSGYSHRMLGGRTLYAFGRPFTICPSLITQMAAWRPDSVVSVLTRSNIVDVLRLGYWCRRSEIPFVLWVGDVEKPRVGDGVPGVLTKLFAAAFDRALRLADGYISYSQLSDDWLDRRAPLRPRVTGTQVLDGVTIPPRVTPQEGPVIRMLFVGKHERRKGLVELASALHRLPSSALQRLEFTTVGSGPLQDSLAGMLPAALKTVVLGDKSRDDLWRIYAGADFLILPSLEDPWGFVTNEAMATGTPVACSTRCGSAELAAQAGWTFDPEDVDGLCCVLRAAMHEARTPARRKAAIEAEARFRPEISASRIVDWLGTVDHAARP